MLDHLRKVARPRIFYFSVLFSLVASALNAQTNATPADTNNRSIVELREEARSECIAGRRRICGRILELLPDGLVIESGYTNLLRDPLTRSWLAPGTAVASLATNLVESAEPGAICVGRVFLSNPPRGRGAKPARYDYVITEGYPCGQSTYKSTSGIFHTVRWFSANLNKAVEIKMARVLKQASAAPSVK